MTNVYGGIDSKWCARAPCSDYTFRGMSEMERRAARAFAIRRAMDLHGMKAPEVADRVHKDPNTVRRWMNGHTAPSTDDLIVLAELFGLDAADLTTPPPIPVYDLDEKLLRAAVRQGARAGLERLREIDPESEGPDRPRKLRRTRGPRVVRE